MWPVATTLDSIASSLTRKICVTHKTVHLVSGDLQGPWIRGHQPVCEGVIVPKTKADTLAGRLDTKLSCELAGSGAAALSQYAWNFAHFGTENTMSWEAHQCGADWNHWSLWLVPLPKRGGSGSRNTHWLSGG